MTPRSHLIPRRRSLTLPVLLLSAAFMAGLYAGIVLAVARQAGAI